MSDTDESKRPKTLSLKKTETSTVKQSFSHGRTKAVVVEKKRTLGAPGPVKPAEKKAPTAEKPVPVAVETAKSARNSPTAWPSAPST
jgi:translation initiation factor IF-2